MERFAQDVGRFAGPANSHYTRGTSEIYGTVQDRGLGAYGAWGRYPKGLKANAAGTVVLVSPSDGTASFVLAAGEQLLYKWKLIKATDSMSHGTSSLDNFVIIWD